MRKTMVGVVVGDKMQKTLVVEFERFAKHPLYKKYIRKRTRVYVHDEKNECKVGDKVLIAETRPLSKLKRWRVLKKLS